MVRNAIKELANKQLIQRCEAEKRTGQRVRVKYRRYDQYMGLKDEILKLAANPAKRESLPTKRSGKVQVTQSRARSGGRARGKRKLNLMFLVATPYGDLRTDLETRLVVEELRGSTLRDQVECHIRMAADLDVVLKGLNDTRPQIVHFSGHANEIGIALDNGSMDAPDDYILPYDELKALFEATDSPPKLVVLNACETEVGAETLAEIVPAVIGMNDSITDAAAAVFSAQLYSAIASGQSLQSAFRQGLAKLKHASINDYSIPQLVCAAGIDPKKLVLIR